MIITIYYVMILMMIFIIIIASTITVTIVEIKLDDTCEQTHFFLFCLSQVTWVQGCSGFFKCACYDCHTEIAAEWHWSVSCCGSYLPNLLKLITFFHFEIGKSKLLYYNGFQHQQHRKKDNSSIHTAAFTPIRNDSSFHAVLKSLLAFLPCKMFIMIIIIRGKHLPLMHLPVFKQ